MKKSSIGKSLAIILASTIMVTSLSFMNVSAVSTDVLREANFDSVVKASITPTSISAYSTDFKNNVTTDVPPVPLNLINLATNPVTNDSSDKTLRLTSGTGNPAVVFKMDSSGYANTFSDIKVNVMEFSILRTDHRATQAFEIFDSAYKKIYPVQIDAAGKVEMKDNTGAWVVKSSTALTLNTWHTFTFIFDLTGTDKYLTLYVNGTKIDTLMLNSTVAPGVNLATLFGIWASTNKSTNFVVNTYFNDIRFYTANNATVNFATPKSNDVYTCGSTVKLDARTFMGNNSKFIKKVQFYVNNILVGEKTSAPYVLNYTPLYSGNFELTAKMFDEDNTLITSAPVIFSVSPNKYKETEVFKHDFNSYTGGALTPVIGETITQSKVSGALVDGYYTANQVDATHGKSLVMKSGTEISSTEIFMDLPYNKKPTGSFHLTGEFLFNDAKHQRLSFVIRQNSDVPSGRPTIDCFPIDFTSLGAVKSSDGATTYMSAFVDDKWYKIDIIGEVSAGTLTVNAYIDGKLYAVNKQYTGWVQIDRIYIAKQNQGSTLDGYVSIDNVSLYTLASRQIIESVGVYKGATSVNRMSQLAGGDTIILKSDIAPYAAGDNKYCLLLATYNNGVLANLTIKDFNSVDKFETTVTLPGVIANYNVKAFLWNGINEIKPLVNGIDFNTTP